MAPELLSGGYVVAAWRIYDGSTAVSYPCRGGFLAGPWLLHGATVLAQESSLMAPLRLLYGNTVAPR